MKTEVVSVETIKPSSPTPDHLRTFQISLFDQVAPPAYVPIILFFSADDIKTNSNVDEISNRLKKSLSETLTHFYPLAGRLDGNTSIHCNDEGATYNEARSHIDLSEILRSPDMNLLQQFLPPDDGSIARFQVNIFDCGGIGIGLCFSHKIVDGATLATFLNAWSGAAIGSGDEMITPRLDTALLFPPKESYNTVKEMPSGVIGEDKTVTRRFVFDAKGLSLLREKFANTQPKPTRVEAVTSFIWKSAMAVTRKPSVVTHVVNIRGKMKPPLPENSLGNLWMFAVASLMEEERKLELDDLVKRLRKAIKEIDGDHIRKIQGNDEGLFMVKESLKEVNKLSFKGELELYRFSSWSRFGFYEIDFGFGKPTWVCTTNGPIKNVVILMGTKSGDGIEAWVTMTERDMAKFECQNELLECISSTPAS